MPMKLPAPCLDFPAIAEVRRALNTLHRMNVSRADLARPRRTNATARRLQRGMAALRSAERFIRDELDRRARVTGSKWSPNAAA